MQTQIPLASSLASARAAPHGSQPTRAPMCCQSAPPGQPSVDCRGSAPQSPQLRRRHRASGPGSGSGAGEVRTTSSGLPPSPSTVHSRGRLLFRECLKTWHGLKKNYPCLHVSAHDDKLLAGQCRRSRKAPPIPGVAEHIGRLWRCKVDKGIALEPNAGIPPCGLLLTQRTLHGN